MVLLFPKTSQFKQIWFYCRQGYSVIGMDSKSRVIMRKLPGVLFAEVQDYHKWVLSKAHKGD
jgi:hypothetical protein